MTAITSQDADRLRNLVGILVAAAETMDAEKSPPSEPIVVLDSRMWVFAPFNLICCVVLTLYSLQVGGAVADSGTRSSKSRGAALEGHVFPERQAFERKPLF